MEEDAPPPQAVMDHAMAPTINKVAIRVDFLFIDFFSFTRFQVALQNHQFFSHGFSRWSILQIRTLHIQTLGIALSETCFEKNARCFSILETRSTDLLQPVFCICAKGNVWRSICTVPFMFRMHKMMPSRNIFGCGMM